MTRFIDYGISAKPFTIADLKVDPSLLQHKSLTVLDVGHLPARTHFRRQAQFIGKWAIIFIASGRGTYQVNDGEIQQVRRHTLFLCYPGAFFHFGPQHGEQWEEYYFTFTGTRVQEWLDTWLFAPGTVKPVEHLDGQQHKIEQLFQLMHSGLAVYADRAALLLESLLFDWITNTSDTPRNKASMRVLEDMSASIYEPFNVQQLCARHHISRSTLKRIVRNYTGFPLYEYMHRLKITEAKQLLLHTDQTVKEIAAVLGYKDVFYFSKLFKKVTGVAPNTFRQMQR